MNLFVDPQDSLKKFFFLETCLEYNFSTYILTELLLKLLHIQH